MPRKLATYPLSSVSGDFSLAGVDAAGNVKLFSKADLLALFGAGNGGTVDPPLSTGMMRGVNLSGAEYGQGAQHPVTMAIAYYISQKKMNVVRIPLDWRVLQPTLGGALDSGEVAWLTGYLAQLRAVGARAIIEPHNQMRRPVAGMAFGALPSSPEYIVGQTSNVTIDNFANFWSRMAGAFPQDNVIYGLMNEPHDQDDQILLNAHNAAISAIRAAARANLILVNGNDYGSHYYQVGQPNRTFMPQIVDSANNWAIDLHHYVDPFGSGGDASVGSNQMDFLIQCKEWAASVGIKIFLGEFGAGSDAPSLAALTSVLSYVEANPSTFIGWTYWAGGGWWNPNYFTRLDPFSYDGGNPDTNRNASWANPVDRPQMQVVQQYLTGASAYNGPTPGTNLLQKSNDFTNAAWEGTGVTKTAGSYTGKSTPPTGRNATRIQGGAYSGIYQNTGSMAAGAASIYVRSLTGVNQTVSMYKNASTTSQRTITPSWTRIEIAIDANFGRLHLEPTDAYDIEVSSAQLNAGTTATTYQDNA